MSRTFIFGRTGKVVKRHEGVHREFARLALDEPSFRRNTRPQQLKTAARFVECIKRVLTPSGGPLA